MRNLEISGRKVTANTEALAKGLYEMHKEKDALAPLAFGMLDAQLMEMFERHLKQKVHEQFSRDILVSHKEVIGDWLRECTREVTVGIYKQSTMLV